MRTGLATAVLALSSIGWTATALTARVQEPRPPAPPGPAETPAARRSWEREGRARFEEQLQEAAKLARSDVEGASRILCDALASATAAGDQASVFRAAFRIGTCRRFQGRLEEALAEFEHAASAARTAADGEPSKPLRDALHEAARTAVLLRRWERADALLTDVEIESVELAQAPDRRRFEAAVLRTEIAVETRRYDEGLNRAARAEEMALGMTEVDPALRAQLLRVRGSAWFESGDPGAAQASWDEALDLLAKIEPTPAAMIGDIRAQRARALFRAGRTEDGSREFDRVWDEAVRRTDPTDESLAVLAHIRGMALFEAELPDEARPWFERASAIIRARPGVLPEVLAQRQKYVAQILLFLGRHDEARDVVDAALAVIGDAADSLERSTLLLLRATVASRAGDVGAALKDSRAALDMLERIDGVPPGLRAEAHMEHAMALHVRGLHSEAFAGYRKALDSLGADSAATSLKADILASIGAVQRALGQTDDAVKSYEAAIAAARRSCSPNLAANLARRGRLELKERSQPESAAAFFGEAADLLEASRERTKSLDEFDRSAFAGALDPYHAHDGLAWALADSGDTLGAVRSLERGRSRTLLDLLQRSRFDPLAEVERRARERRDDGKIGEISAARTDLARAEAGVTAAIQALRTVQDSKTRGEPLLAAEAQLRAAHDAQRAAVRRRAALIAETFEPATVSDPEAIRRSLEDGDLLLYYSVTGWGSRAFALRRRGPAVVFDLKWRDGADVTSDSIAAPLRDHLAALQSAAPWTRDPAGPAKREEWEESGAALFSALVPEGLWTMLRESRRVYLVPHGALHGLVFETLIPGPPATPDATTAWIDSGPPIAYVASGSILKWCLGRRRQRASVNLPLELLALGDPIFVRPPAAGPVLPAAPGATNSPPAEPIESPPTTRGDDTASVLRYGRLARLPGSRREVEAIDTAIREQIRRAGGADPDQAARKTRVLLGDEATEPNLLELAPTAKRIHLATHMVRPRRGVAALNALALTVPPTASVEDDGFLRLQELFERWRDRLAACDLITLSACESGRGEALSDEGVFAMPWGFLYAGASTVVASHWPVEDSATAVLMSTFFEHLAATGETTKLDAFTQARRALRASKPHPRYWAPFVLYGDPR